MSLINYIEGLFGGHSDHTEFTQFEVKQYSGDHLVNTWYAQEVHETQHGYSFVDNATQLPVFVTGTLKITASQGSTAPAVITPATTDATTPAAAQ